jgi:hypothetical protein
MKLDAQPNAESLAVLGAQAVDLLCRGDFDTLARQYGYALSYGREAADAIRDDLSRCLSEIGATTLASEPGRPVPTVTFYQTNSASLVAVIECFAPTSTGAAVLVELVVTTVGDDAYITLEDVSAPSSVRDLRP